MSVRAWYVAKTKPRQEDQVAVVLGQRGVEVFLPKIAARRGERTKASPRLEPLFPGYLFARMDLRSTDWLVARSAPGVAYFLGSDGAPTAVPDDLVDIVRVRADEQRQRGWQPAFRSGDRVTITSGPLAGLDAVFDGTLSPTGRSRVFVEVVSRLVPVVLSASHLRRAG